MKVLKDAGIPFSVGTTVHQKNYNEIREIAALVGSHGAEGYYIGPMYPAGRAVSLTDLIITQDNWDSAVLQYMEAIRDGLVSPADEIWYKLVKDAEPGENPVRDQLYITRRGSRDLRIDPMGNAYVMAKLRQWHPRFWTLGNVLQFPLRAIWHHSRLLNELRSYPVSSTLLNGVDVRIIRTEEQQAKDIAIHTDFIESDSVLTRV
ncbi:MAG: hypothetical protein MJA27_33645 [Pseudanabaenales cyanobacterium]|nr:hypothetical protein [Pseudanabaenales cyanobacterium]